MFAISNQEEAFYLGILADFMGIFGGIRPNCQELVEKKSELRYKSYTVEWGISKIALIPKEKSNYVIKIPFRFDSGRDWCKTEVEIYERIRAAGYEKYFAAEQKYFENSAWVCYLQVRADGFGYGYNYDSPLTRADYERAEDVAMDEEVAQAFAEYYSEDEFRDLMRFIEDEGIHDLHSGNVGFFKGYPVFIDYSGC